MSIIAKGYATPYPEDTQIVKVLRLSDNADTAQFLTDHKDMWWVMEHDGCGCGLTGTDCCDPDGNTFECQTVKVLDSNGDVDVVVCMEGYGCTLDRMADALIKESE